MSKEELKILLYRLIDSLDSDYSNAYTVALHNFQLSEETNNDDILVRLLVVYSALKQKEAIKRVCADISRILYNDGKL